MNTIAMRDARENFSDTVNRVAFAKERISLTRKNKPVAYIVPIEDIELLELLEDKFDLLTIEKELNADESTISLEDLKAELGL